MNLTRNTIYIDESDIRHCEWDYADFPCGGVHHTVGYFNYTGLNSAETEGDIEYKLGIL